MKTKLILVPIFLALFFGCEKDDVIIPQNNTLVANAGTPGAIKVYTGQVVTLNGEHSIDKAGKPFQFLWRLKARPGASLAQLEQEATVNPKFTPDKSGVYILELKIYNPLFYDTDEISIAVSDPDNPPADAIVIDQDIIGEYHLANVFDNPDEIDYLVTSDIHVKGALTIDPSVTIAFEQGVGMYIDNPGSIVTIAAMDKNVVFTGKSKTPGYWKGLIINSSSTINILDNTIIEYGGGVVASGMEVATNLGLDNSGPGKITLKSTRIQHGAAYGMVAEVGTSWSMDHNSFIKNNQIPVQLPASQLKAIHGLIGFKDNTANVIEVIGDRVNVAETSFWTNATSGGTPNSSVMPYIVKGTIEIASSVQITPGAIFEMENNAGIVVTPSGQLSARGTAHDPIKFYGSQSGNGNGYWKGLSFQSNNPNNELSFVEVTDAGSEAMEGFTQKAAVNVEGETTAKLKMTSTKIKHSGGSGLYLEDRTDLLPGFDFNLFEGNKASAIVLSANQITNLSNSAALTFIENGHNGVEIVASALSLPINQEAIWPPLHFGATYLVSGNIAVHSGLKIRPGTLIRFDKDVMLGIFQNGYLDAPGLEGNEIVFTGADPINGFWNGIIIRSSSPKNKLIFAKILYAGKTEMVGIGKVASIGLDGDYNANLTIVNSRISNGLGYGIALEDNRAIINNEVEAVNQFEDLYLGPLYR